MCTVLFTAALLDFGSLSVARSMEPILQEVAEPLLRSVPVGVIVDSSLAINKTQVNAIATKLGAKIDSLTNSRVRIHGSPIQVNVITTSSEEDAAIAYRAIAKSPPFCFIDGRRVVELVDRRADEALAIKTSYELGLIDKPKKVRYRIEVEIATIQKADAMACNQLFNLLLASDSGSDRDTTFQIDQLKQSFVFGNTVSLRCCEPEACAYTFLPAPIAERKLGATVQFDFREKRERHGVPFVQATIEITVPSDGLTEDVPAADDASTKPTEFWPADSPEIIRLASETTEGKTTREAKVLAILDWLTPGKNIRYSGKTGSRWGTSKVLEQQFGHCWDFSDCFVTLARAADIPSRQVAGWLFGSSGHVWAEYYREGIGWQQVDPTGSGEFACGIYHLPYFTTDDGEMPIVYLSLPKIAVVSTHDEIASP